MNVFIDTNVVIDLLDRREPFCLDAVEIFTLAHERKITLFISPLSYATAAYLLRKHEPDHIKLLLRNLRQLSNVTVADEDVVDNALASSFNDYEDALQYYSAMTVGANVILTRNKKDFLASSIPVLSPSEFLIEWKKR